MNVEHAINLIRTNAKDCDLAVLAYCESERLSLKVFCNQVALAVAAAFLANRIDYDYGDDVMNYLMGFMTSEFFLRRNENTVPEPAWSICHAFDRGEYWMKNVDLPSEVPSEKYTRPALTKLLSGHIDITVNLEPKNIVQPTPSLAAYIKATS